MPKITVFPSEENIPVFVEVADRVEFIADLMEGLAWKRGKSAKVLAKVWNLAKSTVESYSAEASRQVTADRDHAARTISVICENMMKEAATAGKVKDAAMIGKLWADVSGANAPQKQEVAIVGDINKDRARKLMGAVFSGGVGKDSDASARAIEDEPEAIGSAGPDLESTTDDE